MKNYMLLLVLLALTQSSCAFLGGAATGAVAAGAGYEIQAFQGEIDAAVDSRRRC
jgi:hypothetical protein